MKPLEVVRFLLQDKGREPVCDTATAFAPLNIALIKYWGKRDTALNLPVTDSLSLTFPEWGTTTSLKISDTASCGVNGITLGWETPFGQRLKQFLALFELSTPLSFETSNNIPTSAGVASSSSGFAALMKTLNLLYGWELDATSLSLLARLGSGSACRSFWPGFVMWKRGERPDGLDSHGVPLASLWPNLRAGILLVDHTSKPLSSREAMRLTRETSPYDRFWPEIVAHDRDAFLDTLSNPDFQTMGTIIERQALSLHWLMGTSTPPTLYTQPGTIRAIQQIYALRASGHIVYWTQDAGPNLKLFFQALDEVPVCQAFPDLLLSDPFAVSDSISAGARSL